MRVGVRIGVRVRVRVSVGLTVTSCGLPMTTPSATKTEPMMARFVGVPLALMKEKRPPPCRSEPVATCDAGGRTVDGRTVEGQLWSQCGGADRRAS